MTSITSNYPTILGLSAQAEAARQQSLTAGRSARRAGGDAWRAIKNNVAGARGASCAENAALKCVRPSHGGAYLAEAWPGAFAVVVPAPEGCNDTNVHIIKRIIRAMVPNCAAIEFTPDFSGAHAIFRSYAPTTLGSAPAFILLSGKGRALWNFHVSLAPPASFDAMDKDKRTMVEAAFWSLFTYFDEDDEDPGSCDAHDYDEYSEGALADLELHIPGMPYVRVCEGCHCSNFPADLEGWEGSVLDEYERLNTQASAPDPPAETSSPRPAVEDPDQPPTKKIRLSQ